MLTDTNWHSWGFRRSRTCWRFWKSLFFLGINLNSFFSRGLTRSFKPFIRCSTQDKAACMLSVSLNCTMANTPCERRVTHHSQTTLGLSQKLSTSHKLQRGAPWGYGCHLKWAVSHCEQLTDLVFIHDNIWDWPKLLEVVSYVSLRYVRLDATNKHTVLILGPPGGPHIAQRLVFPPLDMLFQAWHCGKDLQFEQYCINMTASKIKTFNQAMTCNLPFS